MAKKKAAVKKIAAPSKKTPAKKKVATAKKAAPAAKTTPKKKVAAQKVTTKKNMAEKKKITKVAAPKKAAPKKAAPSKKVAPKKIAPKKAAVAKKTDVKKVAPAKKKEAEKKAVVVKKSEPKKAAPAKKVVPKKEAESKKIAPKKEAPKAEVAKPAAVKKPPVKKAAPEKTISRRSVVVEIKEGVSAPPRSIRDKSKEFIPTAPTEIKTIKNTEGKVLSHRPTHELAGDDESKDKGKGEKKRKSILGKNDQDNTFKRYSDKDLEQFRQLIDEKLIKARTELQYLQGLITKKDSSGTDDTENRYASMEDGSMANEREQLNQMASRQIKFISHLEKALIRIENKTYGICRETGELIDKQRLIAVPHATLSKAAKDANR